MSGKLTPGIIRLGLIFVVLFAFGVVVAGSLTLGLKHPGTWTTAAAALAVVTAVISSWSTQRIAEMEEARRRPSLQMAFDFESRYLLAQLRITNKGGSPAYNVEIDWERGPFDAGETLGDGDPLDGSRTIRAIAPGESIPDAISQGTTFFQNHSDAVFSGTVTYEEATGRKVSEDFVVSAEEYRDTLTYTEEAPKTYYRLQQLPKEIEKLTKAVKSLKPPRES